MSRLAFFSRRFIELERVNSNHAFTQSLLCDNILAIQMPAKLPDSGKKIHQLLKLKQLANRINSREVIRQQRAQCHLSTASDRSHRLTRCLQPVVQPAAKCKRTLTQN